MITLKNSDPSLDLPATKRDLVNLENKFEHRFVTKDEFQKAQDEFHAYQDRAFATFATKTDLAEVTARLDAMDVKLDSIVTSNDRIARLLLKHEAETAATVHRFDRLEKRIEKVEQVHEICER